MDYKKNELLEKISGKGSNTSCWVTDSILVELLLLLKKFGTARLGKTDLHPISPKTLAPQYQPMERKKRKGDK